MILPERQLAVEHLNEPLIEFAFGQLTAHPKDGLFLYGPHGQTNKSRDIRVGIIGTAKGIVYFKAWAKRLHTRIDVPPRTKGEKLERLHLSNFPGLEEVFRIRFDPDACPAYVLNEREIDSASRVLNLHEAVNKVAKLYVERAKRHVQNDERTVDVWILVVPEIVFERCRPGSKRIGMPMELGDFKKSQKSKVDLPLLAEVIDQESENIFEDTPDFHRQIKAAFLTIGPSQIFRETTLAPDVFINRAGFPVRKTQEPASIAWNFSTGLYYKTQPKPPWRLSSVRPNVCYLGLVFKNLPSDPNGHVCCAAQMFLNEGDGVVFRGANGPWKTGNDEYHLDKVAARSLLTKVLDTYSETHGEPPKEIFIHGQAHFNDEEWRAFESAVPKGTNIVGVRIRTTGGETKLFRDGDYPVLRGTALVLDDRNAYLWTNGYLPQLDTYIGPETPNPLFITLLKAKNEMPPIRVVLNDIMGLTKINYNSCNFNDGLPVTVRFARMVGEVLVMGSAKGVERQPFKYYI